MLRIFRFVTPSYWGLLKQPDKQKMTRLKERLSFIFAVDLLNATNHTNFGGPNTDPTNRDFGKVTSTNGYARVIQLNGRIQF